MPTRCSAIACNLDTNLLSAALPLFESERVQAIEWSFDTLFAHEQLPDWFTELLHTYANAGRLVGHGVFFSLFSGRWQTEQQQWLTTLQQLSKTYRFDHVSEHFGFMTGADFHKGAPIGIPYTSTTLAIGQDRLKRLQQACGCPVGLENLAFSYSVDDVKRHGDFLHQLLEPVDGILILDLHNLYCQLHNFDCDYEELIALYPLERVREIHVSGGSWSESAHTPGLRIRRDTHDEAVPPTVFDLLGRTLDRCPNLQYVVLEQIGTGLDTEASRQQFQQDFFAMDQLVRANSYSAPALPRHSFEPLQPLLMDSTPTEDAVLAAQQQELSRILETARDYSHAQQLLRASSLAQSDWRVETWAPHMLETAVAIAQKWKDGFTA